MSVESNKAAATAMMHNFSAGVFDRAAFTEDATWWTSSTGELPLDQRMATFGKQAASQFAGGGRFEIDSVTAEGDRVVLEARGFQPLKDGRSYDNTYLWLLYLRDGRISRVKAWMDTALVQRTFHVAEPRDS